MAIVSVNIASESRFKSLGYHLLLKEKKIEVNVIIPRVYFFFAGFFSSFLTGFFAIKISSGFNIWQ
jgi:hypothetical protein